MTPRQKVNKAACFTRNAKFQRNEFNAFVEFSR